MFLAHRADALTADWALRDRSTYQLDPLNMAFPTLGIKGWEICYH